LANDAGAADLQVIPISHTQLTVS